jgi:putative inorganic carbon (HCO3(-)) transporter
MGATKISEWVMIGAGCALVFCIPISIAATNILLAMCILAFMVRIFAPGKIYIEKRYAVLLCLYMIATVVSVINSLDTFASIRGIQRLMKHAFVFFALSHTFSREKRMSAVSWAFLFGLLLVSLDGVVQFIAGKDFLRHFSVEIGNPLEGFGGHFKRIGASFHNSLDFASYLAGAVPFALSVARYGGGSPIKKVFYYLTLMLAGICLIFTYSRGAAVGVFIALVICVWVKKDRLLVIFMILTMLCVPFLLADAPLEWAAHRNSPLEFFYDSSRLMHWRTAINMIKAHPFVGAGTNSFCSSYQHFRSPGDHYVGWYAHNSWLQLAAETGFLGSALVLVLIGMVFRSCWQAFRKTQSAYLSAVLLGLCTGLIGYCFAACWDSSLQYSNPAVFFWTMLGLTAAASRCYPVASGEQLK